MSRDGALSQLEKCALVLDAFPGGSALTLTEVCTRTALARSTVHRLLVDMTALGWIDRSGNTFELGIGLFQLGERVAVKHRLRSAAIPFMQDLYAVTGQTVHLAVRNGFDAVYVEKLYGHVSLPLPSQIGGRLPLTCTAVGKALLASEPEEVRAQALAQPLRRYTVNSVTDPKKLTRELDDIRRTGVAIEREESALGGCCLAAPVLLKGMPVAALSVSVPTEQFRPELLAPAVRTAALALGRVLAGTSVSRSG
ncbi:IclR family transcriptional regulator [Mycolicibacterium sp. P9-64]|uniref:IclR family transcriptional regulator n=1 Tax=Mycolicibacterium sp. P9-64 TaxID=2024612 RepID=UPI0011F06DA5|nr:IclR family transcriptional regulator [Mycolicibacterium sp. P9-64]KAA0086818.1 IclR family transcriptional regulator [Mycolicibacterium sp. P9-64]